MNPQPDSLAVMRPDEIRALVAALLDAIGGEITLNEDELWRAHRDVIDHVVQVEVTDSPRTARVRLVRNDIVAGTVTT